MIHGISAMGISRTGGGGPAPVHTMSLLHFDGADGSTTFTDEAGVIWTPAGNAQLDTAESMFGGSSLLLDGTGDWLDATEAAFQFGSSGDFTKELRARPAAISGNHFAFGFGSGWGVYCFGSQWAVFDGVASNVIQSGSGAAVINTWYHVAIVRAAGILALYIDGSSIGTVANTTNFNVGNVRIGAQTGGAGGFNGWIDEARISDSAIYTTTFVPGGPFTYP